jgi:hypothetical protein
MSLKRPREILTRWTAPAIHRRGTALLRFTRHRRRIARRCGNLRRRAGLQGTFSPAIKFVHFQSIQCRISAVAPSGERERFQTHGRLSSEPTVVDFGINSFLRIVETPSGGLRPPSSIGDRRCNSHRVVWFQVCAWAAPIGSERS